VAAPLQEGKVTVISVEHLTKTFGSFTAVDDVSFEVKRGEVFAFLGPNGSGKTTTLKSIVGLTLPTKGAIRINGIDVAAEPKKARNHLSYLPQRVIFPETLTAREVVRFYSSLRSIPAAVADAALSKAGFNGHSDKPVQEFSGGMVQRLGMTVVSIPDSPILLLDEPTANLDPQGVKIFRDFILDQKAKGKTIIFSTHLLAEAEQLADRVAIFVAGRIAALESIEDLRRTFLMKGTIEDVYLHYVGSARHEG
jgi:ABC-type multidrug transport system ATPase subunit